MLRARKDPGRSLSRPIHPGWRAHIRAAILAALGAVACGGAPPPGEPGARACPGGDAVVQVEAEAAALAGCAVVPGDLTVGPSFTLSSATGLGDVRHVRGALDVSDNLSLGGVYLGALVWVRGDLVIENNRALATASLHRLTDVGGDLIVRGNRALERLDLAALRRVGGRILIAGLPALEAVELGALRSAGSIEIDDVPAWPADEIEAVKRRLVAPGAARQPRAAGASPTTVAAIRDPGACEVWTGSSRALAALHDVDLDGDPARRGTRPGWFLRLGPWGPRMPKSLVLVADPSPLAASRLRFRCSRTSSTLRAGSRRSLPSGRLDHENRATWAFAGPYPTPAQASRAARWPRRWCCSPPGARATRNPAP